jgi:peptidoglycan/LPS O-acetylase OafA/YrhL
MSSGVSSFNKTRWPAIDGLRGLAILSVVCGHYKLHGNGPFGVILFFVISGHVITHSLLEEKSKNGRISFSNFYIRRIARLVPMLIFTCLLTIIFLLITSVPYKTWYLGAIGMLTYTVNLMHLVGLEKNISTYFQFNWSLGFEEQFYLIWPTLVFYACKNRMRYKLLLLIAISLISILSLIVTYPTSIYGDPKSFAVILLGTTVAIMFRIFKTKHSRPPNCKRQNWIDFFSTLVLALLILNLIGSNFPIKFLRENGGSTTALCGAILILLIIRSEPRWLIRVLTIKPLVLIGKMSYTLYMLNLLWFYILELIIPEFIQRHGLTTHLAEASTLFLIAWFIYKKFELPMQNRINHRQKL